MAFAVAVVVVVVMAGSSPAAAGVSRLPSSAVQYLQVKVHFARNLFSRHRGASERASA